MNTFTESGRSPKVKLLSSPSNWAGMLYYVWRRSRNDNELKSSRMYQALFDGYADVNQRDRTKWLDTQNFDIGKDVYDVIQKLLTEDIPVVEHAWFVFEMEDVSVAWREQAVRQRIGTKFGDAYLWEVIGGSSEQSFWSQTSRIIPDHNFYDEGRFMIPQTVKNAGKEAVSLYLHTLKGVQDTILRLSDMGIPPEDTRMLSPAGKTHSISWALNLKALMHVVKKRSCFVMQAGLWAPVISQMVDELERLSPIFRDLVRPPCFAYDNSESKYKFKGCPIKLTNTELINGEDRQPVCPIFLHYHTKEALAASDSVKEPAWYPTEEHMIPPGMYGDQFDNMPVTDSDRILVWSSDDPVRRMKMRENREAFSDLWKMDVNTGEPLTQE